MRYHLYKHQLQVATELKTPDPTKTMSLKHETANGEINLTRTGHGRTSYKIFIEFQMKLCTVYF